MTFTKYNGDSRPIFLQVNLLNIYELSTDLTALFFVFIHPIKLFH